MVARLLIGLVVLAACPAQAAFVERPASARAAALAEAMTAAEDGNALFYNPAGLAFARQPELAASHGELFNLNELAFQSVGAVQPLKRGAFGIFYSQFGPDLYREREVIVSHGFSVSSGAALGYSLKHASIHMEKYRSRSAVGADLGIAARILPRLVLGASARNVTQPNFRGVPDGPARDVRAGLAFRPVPGFLTVVDLVKPVDKDLAWRAGEEIYLARALALRFGVETRPNRYALGFGLRWKAVQLDYGLLSHPYLQDQHQASVVLRWGPERAPEPVAAATPKKKARTRRPKIAPGQTVDLNRAAREDLMTLPGIGPRLAERILAYREAHGPFERVADVLKVPHMGGRTFLRIRPFLVVTPPAPSDSPVIPEDLDPAVPPAAPDAPPVPEE